MTATTEPSLLFSSEKDLENFLLNNEEWFKDEFSIENSVLYQQMDLGSYGVPDIVSIDTSDDGTCEITIFELKNTKLKHIHLSQIARYRKFFLDWALLGSRKEVFLVRGVLIGAPSFPGDGDLVFIAQDIEWLDVYEFEVNPSDGMSFRLIDGWRHSKGGENALLKMSKRFDGQKSGIDQ